jgi:hypothetical protein
VARIERESSRRAYYATFDEAQRYLASGELDPLPPRPGWLRRVLGRVFG